MGSVVGNLLFGLCYVAGLVLLLVRPVLPGGANGRGRLRRMARHLVALLLFAVGTVELQKRLGAGSDRSFIVISALVLLVVEGFQLWRQNRRRTADRDDEN